MSSTSASTSLGLSLLLAAMAGCGTPESVPSEASRSGEAPLLGILVTPEDPVVPVGATLQLEATGLYDERESRELTAAVAWESSASSVAMVSNALDGEGQLTAVAPGSTQVWATLDALASVPVTVTVTDKAVDVLAVEPSSATLAVRDAVNLGVTARYSDGTVADASGLVRWVTADPEVASITDGRVEARAVGSTTVHATLGDVSSPPVPIEVVTIPAPDLVVQQLTASGTTDSVRVAATVANTGTTGAAGFWVDVFVDPRREPEVGDIGRDFWPVAYVGPGESKEVVFTLEGLSAGEHTFFVLADSAGEVAEANEGDNLAEVRLDISDGLAPPNLVTDVVLYLSDPYSVYYWVEVTNYGDVSTPPFFVDLWVDRLVAPRVGLDGDTWVEVRALGPWETVAIEFLVDAECDWCWSWVYVDSTDAVDESVESDNAYGPVDVFGDYGYY